MWTTEVALNLNEQKTIIKDCLTELYSIDKDLFLRNNGNGVCERCIAFRFAHYLQKHYPKHFVDCDFNSSSELKKLVDGTIMSTERSGKILNSIDGKEKKLYVDIIIHKRSSSGTDNDLICFELKKLKGLRNIDVMKDYNKLQQMTSDYGYHFGFHLIFGKTKEETKYTIFQNGGILEENRFVFESENNA